jgi:hypothetical protein
MDIFPDNMPDKDKVWVLLSLKNYLIEWAANDGGPRPLFRDIDNKLKSMPEALAEFGGKVK